MKKRIRIPVARWRREEPEGLSLLPCEVDQPLFLLELVTTIRANTLNLVATNCAPQQTDGAKQEPSRSGLTQPKALLHELNGL